MREMDNFLISLISNFRTWEFSLRSIRYLMFSKMAAKAILINQKMCKSNQFENWSQMQQSFGLKITAWTNLPTQKVTSNKKTEYLNIRIFYVSVTRNDQKKKSSDVLHCTLYVVFHGVRDIRRGGRRKYGMYCSRFLIYNTPIGSKDFLTEIQ